MTDEQPPSKKKTYCDIEAQLKTLSEDDLTLAEGNAIVLSVLKQLHKKIQNLESKND